MKDLVNIKQDEAEMEEDIFSQFFIDPFKYHELAEEHDKKQKASENIVEAFRVYQEGDQLTKKSPAVTFGKGMRKPPG